MLLNVDIHVEKIVCLVGGTALELYFAICGRPSIYDAGLLNRPVWQTSRSYRPVNPSQKVKEMDITESGFYLGFHIRGV